MLIYSVLAILFGLLLVAIIGYFLLILYMSQRGANYVRTPRKAIGYALSILKQGDIFVDLGFGNGEVLDAAIQKGATRVIGYELDYIRFLTFWWKRRGDKRYLLRYGDIWSADLSTADVVYTFFTDIHMKRLHKKAKREMKKGSWFVSYVHRVPNVTPTKQIGDVQYFQM